MSTAVRDVQPTGASMVRDLIALTKPRVTFMVLVTTGGGLALAPRWPDLAVALLTLVGTALVVGSANALNCWMERESDARMLRTRNRPLPAGRLDARIALGFGLGLGAISVPMLALAVNPLTGLLAACALVSYVWIYTPMKQRSPSALLIGSVPGAMPPLMGWTAATGALEAPGIVLFGILFLWQLPHFIAISMFRQNEYAKAGIKVLPWVRGRETAKLHAVLWAGALVPVSLLLVPLGIVGELYLAVVGVAGVVFFAMCLAGLRSQARGNEGASNRWARSVFIASLVYLPLLCAAIALDVLS